MVTEGGSDSSVMHKTGKFRDMLSNSASSDEIISIPVVVQ